MTDYWRKLLIILAVQTATFGVAAVVFFVEQDWLCAAALAATFLVSAAHTAARWRGSKVDDILALSKGMGEHDRMVAALCLVGNADPARDLLAQLSWKGGENE